MPGTSPDPGFSQKLNYQAMVGNGVMVLKDRVGGLTGPLLAGFWYDGVDHENASSDDMDEFIRAANLAFTQFSAGWMLHFEVMRRSEHSYQLGYFDEPVDQLIEEERCDAAHFWRVDCAVFLTYTPSALEETFKGLVSSDDTDQVQDAILRRVNEFEQQLKRFSRSFSMQFTMRRMRYTRDNDELLQALNYVLNGRWHPCRLPDNPIYLDTVLARELLLTKKEFVHADDCVAVVGVAEFPESATGGLLTQLRELNVDYRIGARFIFLDQNVAQRKLERLESKWTQVSELLMKMKVGSFDKHAEERAHEVSYALKDANDGQIRFGHFTLVFVFRAPTQPEANEKAELVLELLQSKGFHAVLEGKNRMEAYLGSLPGHGKQNLRLPLVNTVNLGMLCDLERAWPGEATCPSTLMPKNSQPLMRVRNWHGGYFDLNLHERQVAHALIIGNTGGGKTTLITNMCSQWLRYPESQVIVFDRDRGSMAITLARSDGAFYAIGDAEGPQLAPLAELDTPEDLDWAEHFVAELCAHQGVAVEDDGVESKCIRRALRVLAAIPKELGTGRRLTDLLPHLQHDRLENALEYYVSGQGARVLNGARTSISYGRFTTFELGKLLADMPSKVITPTLMFLFRLVDKRCDGRPLMVHLAEVWDHLKREQSQAQLEKWLGTLRKFNAFVVMDLHQPGQVADSKIAEAIFSMCPTRIFIPTRLSDKSREMYASKLGLSARQIQQLTTMANDPDAIGWYLLVKGKYSRWFNMGLGPVAASFCAAGSVPEIKLAAKMARTYGDAWPEHWLRHRGLAQQASRLAELRVERSQKREAAFHAQGLEAAE